VDAGVLVPLGVFAMLVAGWFIQSRMAIAQLQALAQERVAPIEKGVPLPPREAELPKPPVRAGHPLKPTLAVLAVGIALWVGLSQDHRVWGMVVTAFGIAGLGHWFVAGSDEWKRQTVMDEEMHQAYVEYLKALASASTSADGPKA
jgi:hypothetical protein